MRVFINDRDPRLTDVISVWQDGVRMWSGYHSQLPFITPFLHVVSSSVQGVTHVLVEGRDEGLVTLARGLSNVPLFEVEVHSLGGLSAADFWRSALATVTYAAARVSEDYVLVSTSVPSPDWYRSYGSAPISSVAVMTPAGFPVYVCSSMSPFGDGLFFAEKRRTSEIPYEFFVECLQMAAVTDRQGYLIKDMPSFLASADLSLDDLDVVYGAGRIALVYSKSGQSLSAYPGVRALPSLLGDAKMTALYKVPSSVLRPVLGTDARVRVISHDAQADSYVVLSDASLPGFEAYEIPQEGREDMDKNRMRRELVLASSCTVAGAVLF